MVDFCDPATPTHALPPPRGREKGEGADEGWCDNVAIEARDQR